MAGDYGVDWSGNIDAHPYQRAVGASKPAVMEKEHTDMKKIETYGFLLTFLLLFALFYGLAFFTADLDWTWARILIGLVTVGSVTIAWSSDQ